MFLELTNNELVQTLEHHVRVERESYAEVIKHLAEFEERQAFLPLGYSSTFDYLTKKLEFSEASATRRVRAARALIAVPEALQALESNDVTFTAIESCSELLIEKGTLALEALKGKTKEEVRYLKLAQSEPKPVRDSIVPLASFAPLGQLGLEEFLSKSFCNRSGGELNGTRGEEKAVEQRFKLSFSASNDFMQKLERVQELKFRGRKEDVSLEAVFEEALELMLEKHAPERRIERREKRTVQQKSNPESRHVPTWLRDEVISRDEFRCSFVSSDGLRCACRSDLEVDHIHPFALGGKTSSENLRTLCRAHNQFAAREIFG